MALRYGKGRVVQGPCRAAGRKTRSALASSGGEESESAAESQAPSPLRPEESAEQAAERRIRESEQVEQRLEHVADLDDLRAQLLDSSDLLTVVEVQSDSECEVFDGADHDGSKSRRMEACNQLRSSLQRCVRDCESTRFVSVLFDGSESSQRCADWLGVEHFPTLQFWKSGQLLWQHVGAQDQQDLGEGLLFFGDEAKGMRASDFVSEVTNQQELDSFINGQEDDDRIALLDVSDETSDPCVHMYAAVFSLARGMKNNLRCARLIADKDASTREAARKLGVTQVPSFFVFKGGEQVGLYVGSSRGELVGRVMMAADALPNSQQRTAEDDRAPEAATP